MTHAGRNYQAENLIALSKIVKNDFEGKNPSYIDLVSKTTEDPKVGEPILGISLRYEKGDLTSVVIRHQTYTPIVGLRTSVELNSVSKFEDFTSFYRDFQIDSEKDSSIEEDVDFDTGLIVLERLASEYLGTNLSNVIWRFEGYEDEDMTANRRDIIAAMIEKDIMKPSMN